MHVDGRGSPVRLSGRKCAGALLSGSLSLPRGTAGIGSDPFGNVWFIVQSGQPPRRAGCTRHDGRPGNLKHVRRRDHARVRGSLGALMQGMAGRASRLASARLQRPKKPVYVPQNVCSTRSSACGGSAYSELSGCSSNGRDRTAISRSKGI